MRITIKLGGSILEDVGIRLRLLAQVTAIVGQGHETILVHGGGKSLSRRLDQLKIASQFINGLRVTDAETLGVAIMVLAGEINKKIVSELINLGTGAIGICGADAAAVRCLPLSDMPGYSKEIGFVGKPSSVNKSFFDLILGSGLVPVVSSIALGQDNQLYNINADQMAAACASGAACTSLIYLTDVPGVRDEEGSVLSRINKAGIFDLRARGVISGGMLPKTSSCLEALEAGVESVYILPGASPDILLRFMNKTLMEGTEIYGTN